MGGGEWLWQLSHWSSIPSVLIPLTCDLKTPRRGGRGGGGGLLENINAVDVSELCEVRDQVRGWRKMRISWRPEYV